MAKAMKKIRLSSGDALLEAVEGIKAGAPIVLQRGEGNVAVVLTPEDYEALAGRSAPAVAPSRNVEEVRAALRAVAGALSGVDREALLRDIRRGRGQASRRRLA